MRFAMVLRCPDGGAAIGAYTQELARAGVLLAAEVPDPGGPWTVVHPGGRVATGGAGCGVTGFWLVELTSVDEAVAWARRLAFESGTLDIQRLRG
jgi:hypothetical protein